MFGLDKNDIISFLLPLPNSYLCHSSSNKESWRSTRKEGEENIYQTASEGRLPYTSHGSSQQHQPPQSPPPITPQPQPHRTRWRLIILFRQHIPNLISRWCLTNWRRTQILQSPSLSLRHHSRRPIPIPIFITQATHSPQLSAPSQPHSPQTS